MMDEAARLRARERFRTWRGVCLTLQELAADLPPVIPVENRFVELYALSQRAHALSGEPRPRYTRLDMPGRLRSLTQDE